MNTDKRTIWVIGGALAIVVIGVTFYLGRQSAGPVLSEPGAGSPAAPMGASSPTHSAAPANAVAPNEGEKQIAAAEVAVPVAQVPAAPGSSASLRQFSLKVQGGSYNPNQIIVNQGDTVNINLTAVDANYGFTQPDYGLNAVVKQGQTRMIGFQALQPGKFTFYCSSCGGPAKGPVGYIIVTNK